MNDFFEISIAFLFVILTIIIFIHISRKLRRGGGSLTTTMLGATDLFYDKEKKAAVSQIVEMKSGKKQEEQGTEKSKE
jgi:hypothetical protein